MNDKTLSILMVHPHDLWYDPWTIRIAALARQLIRMGHQVKLCHLPRKEKPDSPPIRHPQNDDPEIFELLPRQVHFIQNFKTLYSLAKDCDVIHIQKCFASTALPVLWVSRLLHKPLHYDWDDNETAIANQVEKRMLARMQIALYEKMLPNFPQSITYASEWIRNQSVLLGFPEAKLHHLPVGADLNLFHPQTKPAGNLLQQWGVDTNKTTVLYVGQMEGAAHAHLLIDAARIVLEQHRNTQFLLVGGGEQLEEMRNIACESPASESLFLPGYVEQKMIPSIIAAADLCVACFEEDEAARAKSPLKIAEYLASGKPIVASNVGEVSSMVGGCGIPVTAGSSTAIAKGILQYIHDEDRQTHDRILARKKAESTFNWEKGAETLIKCYQSIIH